MKTRHVLHSILLLAALLGCLTAPATADDDTRTTRFTLLVGFPGDGEAPPAATVFPGTVIRLRKGGNDANFTVRRTASHGVGVERTFLLRSPRLEKVEVTRHAHVRRAQLYFLRNRRGKRATLKEKR